MGIAAIAAVAVPIDSELLGDALNLVGSGLIVLDEHRRVVFWNRWVESVSGISLATAAGSRLEELFPELGRGRLPGAVETALTQGFPSVLSQSLNRAPFPFFQHNTLSGKAERVQQKIQVLPIRRAESPPHCLIEVQDVSTSVHREQVLGEQKNFLNTVLESEPEGVLVLSADNELIQLNKAGLDMLELASLAEARATGFVRFIVAEYRDALDRLCRKVLGGDRDVLEL